MSAVDRSEAMDHAPAETPQRAPTAPTQGNRACAECLAPYASAQPGQLFCCPAHREAFQDRLRVRGRQLAPLELAARATRGGSRGDKAIGIRARQAAERLKDRWNAEDKAEGRMPMVDYVRRLSRHFELPA
ncbi:MAG: hypothetical protein V4618_00675 [Pseudomonadota bacterium]